MPHTIKKRFAASLVSNGLRAGMSFLAGLIVARGLGPTDYGRLMFLLGSFVSVKSLLDLGTSNAFYTFISQARRPLAYYTYYLLWLVAQFLITIVVLKLLLPDAVVHQIWVGEDRRLILLAFAASFFQQQLWLTVNQIAEAARKTIRVQGINLALAFSYLAGVWTLSRYSSLSVPMVLGLMVLLYPAAALVAWRILGPSSPAQEEQVSFTGMLGKYRDYCAPLVALSAVTFLYDFADKWMLQRFSGAAQQGFYQVAYQFASISALATASILNIFWKEVSEAFKLGNMSRVGRLFEKVSRGLYMFGALVSGFMIPWSREMVSIFLGPQYAPASMVLGLMFLFPLHQSLGQIGTTMLMAAERTRLYLVISVTIMLANFPVSYFLLAQPDAFLPGLGLGAMGMACKMVFLNMLSVNCIFWMISKEYGWTFKWSWQAAALGLALAAGALAKTAATLVFTVQPGAPRLALLPPFLLAGAAYLPTMLFLLRAFPGLAGLDREELDRYLGKLRLFIP